MFYTFVKKDMSYTLSSMMPLETQAPSFNLLNVVTGQLNNLDQLKGGKATIVVFICNHCPYVIHINEGLIKLANDYKEKGVNLIAISSNDAENFPQDGPEKMKELALKLGYPFPYLYDEDQSVAKAYDAECTPDFFVFGHHLKLKYRGQMDGSRPGSTTPVSGEDIRKALDAIIADKAVSDFQRPSGGCNIKWK